jgi:hypothetical protein
MTGHNPYIHMDAWSCEVRRLHLPLPVGHLGASLTFKTADATHSTSTASPTQHTQRQAPGREELGDPPSGTPWFKVRTHRGTAAPSSSGHSISMHTPATQARPPQSPATSRRGPEINSSSTRHGAMHTPHTQSDGLTRPSHQHPCE